MGSLASVRQHLEFLYGKNRGKALWSQLSEILAEYKNKHPDFSENVVPPRERLSERDVILITYGDQISEPGISPLCTLAEVLETYADGIITGVHILPFFPYSSDDGFSVIDYAQVDPALGTWEDIARMDNSFRLMFDAVINHISQYSQWFQAFQAGDPDFIEAFIVVPPGTDLAEVVRPRALPLLTAVQTTAGEKLVWTTFSTDQIDLNFADPGVLMRIIELLLFYVEKGAEIIRLDAIAYLWKIIGTPCIHLEETHRIVKLFRAVLDLVAPGVMLITETNVPHEENISYFGNGSDEAQLVYQFPLPPLVLHTMITGNASKLSSWASSLSLPSDQTTFYNFLASHDGIGVRPVEGILTPNEVKALAERVLAHGGYASYKTNADGSESVYELNISYFDALSDPEGDEPVSHQVARFMVSQAIMLSLQGVPAIYAHSFFGSRNYPEGVHKTGRYRSINREKLLRDELETALQDPSTVRSQVWAAYHHLLEQRALHPAFHPAGKQKILNISSSVFSLLRTASDEGDQVLCIHNVANVPSTLVLNVEMLELPQERYWLDILGGVKHSAASDTLTLTLSPYQVMWLVPEREAG